MPKCGFSEIKTHILNTFFFLLAPDELIAIQLYAAFFTEQLALEIHWLGVFSFFLAADEFPFVDLKHSSHAHFVVANASGIGNKLRWLILV